MYPVGDEVLRALALLSRDNAAEQPRSDPTVVPGFRSSWSQVRVNLGVELRECVKGRSGACAYAAAAVPGVVRRGRTRRPVVAGRWKVPGRWPAGWVAVGWSGRSCRPRRPG